MPFIYVARSPSLQKWGAEVGLTKQLFKVGVAEDSAEKAVEALNAEQHASQSDWKVLKKLKVDEADLADIIARLSKREREVDPGHYPKLRGARGVFKVRLESAGNYIIVKQALAGGAQTIEKLKPVDIANYLITIGTGQD